MLADRDIVLVFFSLVAPSAAALAADAALLDASEQARAARFVFPQDRDRFITAHAQLRRLLAHYLACPAESLRFTPGPNGKPTLTDLASHRLHFNLSHAQDRGLIGLTRGGPLGVDLEFLARRTQPAEIVERFFSPTERIAWSALPAATQAEAFFRAWTLKEAYVKARGDGLSHSAERYTVDFSESPTTDSRLLADELDPEAPSRYHLASLPAPSGYAAAWCAKAPKRLAPRVRIDEFNHAFVNTRCGNEHVTGILRARLASSPTYL